MSKTPLTDHYTKRLRNFCGDEFVPIEFARKLERELSAVTEQRDMMAEALDRIAVLYESKEMTGTIDQRIADAYDMRCIARSALAAVKGGQP